MEAIGTLAGGIAHDFNNILGAINGYTELAQMVVKDDQELQDYLSHVQQAGVRAADLVRQILAFSRQEVHARHAIQLRHIVAEALKLLRATIPTSIEFKNHLERQPPTVLADPTQVHQIMMNLCTNAWHAMRDHPGRLEVRLEGVDLTQPLRTVNAELAAGRYACLSISDTGCGMDEATLLRIFDPFFTTKQPGEGTGLGLAVVHGIVRSHQAGVTVTSRPGAGTTFKIYFPAHLEEAAAPRPEKEQVVRGKGQRILFVDDEELLVLVAKKSLEKLGYSLVTHTSPVAALEEFHRRPGDFDLVITDLAMPRLSGTDIAEAVRLTRPDLPVILTSGNPGDLSSERIRTAGFRDFLLKPLSLEGLGQAVHRALTPFPA